MSAERCPVCNDPKCVTVTCGAGPCPQAERLAIKRGKEITKLQGRLAEARKIILLHVPDDVGPIAAMECGEWVTWCAGYLESKGVVYD